MLQFSDHLVHLCVCVCACVCACVCVCGNARKTVRKRDVQTDSGTRENERAQCICWLYLPGCLILVGLDVNNRGCKILFEVRLRYPWDPFQTYRITPSSEPYPAADKDRPSEQEEESQGTCAMRNSAAISSANSSAISSSNSSGGVTANSGGGGGGGGGAAGGGGGGAGGGGFNQILGSLLWDRSLPADGGLFQLQYMDLEEFLTDNGMGNIPNSNNNNNSSSTAQVPSQTSPSAVPNQSSQCPPSSPPPCSSSASSTSSSPSLIGLEVAQPQGMLGGSECLHGEWTDAHAHTHTHMHTGTHTHCVCAGMVWSQCVTRDMSSITKVVGWPR